MFKRFKNHILPVLSGVTLLFLVAACADGEEPYNPADETTGNTGEIVSFAPLCITLGGVDWNSDIPADSVQTRALPPGTGNNQQTEEPVDGSAETAKIDEVRLLTFRRVDPDEYEGDVEKQTYYAGQPFIYDRSNDISLPVKDCDEWPEADLFPAHAVTPGHTRHRMAYLKEGIRKIKGFEYRVIAIAFSRSTSSQLSSSPLAGSLSAGDHERFELNIQDGLALDDCKAMLLSVALDNNNWPDLYKGSTSHLALDKNARHLGNNIIETPQLFYGECYTSVNGVKSTLIKYSQNGEDGKVSTTIALEGILYRGVAKVELNVTLRAREATSLISYNTQWLSVLMDGMPGGVSLLNYDSFLKPYPSAEPGSFLPVAYREVTATKNNPVKVETIEFYTLPGIARLALRVKTVNSLGNVDDVRSGLIIPGNQQTDGTGTGIISPDSHGDSFYFRRNHKYIINISNSEAILKAHPLD